LPPGKQLPRFFAADCGSSGADCRAEAGEKLANAKFIIQNAAPDCKTEAEKGKAAIQAQSGAETAKRAAEWSALSGRVSPAAQRVWRELPPRKAKIGGSSEKTGQSRRCSGGITAGSEPLRQMAEQPDPRTKILLRLLIYPFWPFSRRIGAVCPPKTRGHASE